MSDGKPDLKVVKLPKNKLNEDDLVSAYLRRALNATPPLANVIILGTRIDDRNREVASYVSFTFSDPAKVNLLLDIAKSNLMEGEFEEAFE